MIVVNKREYEVTVHGDGFEFYADAMYGDWKLTGKGRTKELAIESLRHEIEDADHFTSRGPDDLYPRSRR